MLGANYNTYFPTSLDKRLSILALKKYPEAENPKTTLIKEAVRLYCDQLEKVFGKPENSER
jgi:hypothetical protein